MRTLLWFILGYGLAIGAALCAIAAGGLVAVGVAAHLFLKREPGMIDVFNFDPSSMIARAPLPGAVALGFLTLYLLVSKRLRFVVRAERLAD
jgi:hypothetical protein